MRIERVEVGAAKLPLTKPYTIARETIADVELFFVRIVAGRFAGSGCASPAVEVTGESPADCRAALDAAAETLRGEDPRAVGSIVAALERDFARAPAARAALDMALWDLLGRTLDAPLVELFGRRHRELPTSVTIGIQPADEALRAADDFLEQRFRALKVKVGRAVEEEIELLRRLRDRVGPAMALRVDANEGWTATELRRFLDGTRELAIELCEQPLAREADAALDAFPAAERATIGADESLQSFGDGARLLAAPRRYGAWVVKLMKCGGISPALALSRLAEAGGIDLMWGSNDESRISIAAALAVAFATPATRWLDLDGSFDLARDVAAGGFVLEHGLMRPADGPGLGVTRRD